MWLALLLFQLNAEPCRRGERPLFHCASQARTYLLCASAELTPEKGYIQFRSGDLQYPTGQELPVRNFEFWMDARGTGVTFNVRGTAFELYSETDADRVTSEGLGRFVCPRLDPAVALSVDGVHAFLRSAGLLR